jgi:inosine-uridine nucleoside N-ribohydrolase
MRRIPESARIVSVGLLGAALAACGPSSQSPTPLRSGEPPTARIPVIVDADFDHSDIAALLILLGDPAIEVRAITIAGTGLVHCQTGRLVTRYLLDELGTPTIPFGCGRETGGPDAHPFPDAWRALADDAYGLDIAPTAEPGVPRDAAGLIAETVDSSRSAPTVVTLGPLTNLEDAFAVDPTLPDRIAGIHAMLGSVDAPGNVLIDGLDETHRLEWNAYADPSAVDAVFATDVPVSIVPLDATDDVPVPVDLAERLASDHQAGAADLMYESLLRNPDRMRVEFGQQLWDELAALTLTDPDLATWEESLLLAEPDGRLTRDEAGRAVRFAIAADRLAVEEAFLSSLRRGGPRVTPFRLAGTLAVSFDGTTCSLRGESNETGLHVVDYAGPSDGPSGVTMAGVRPPNRWEQLLAMLPTIDVAAQPPDWVVVGPVAEDSEGTGRPVSAAGDLEEATYGPLCFRGTFPDVVFTPGIPFQPGVGELAAPAASR